MPTLIRLLVFLLVLGGLAFGGMVALTVMVDPGEREYRVRIPPGDLMVDADGDPLDVRQSLPAPRVSTQPEGEAADPPAQIEDGPPE